MPTKKEIRTKYKQKRLQLSPLQINKLSDLLLIQFQKLGIDIPATIMTYAAFEKMNEFDPQLITEYCYFRNPQQQLAYPVMVEYNDERFIKAVLVTEETIFALNKMGIAEPVNATAVNPSLIEMVIVPLLAFDKKGNRVGYGKGYYDRFLKHCSRQCIKIGCSYFDPVDEITDSNAFDIPLNYCITPTAIFEF